MQHRRVVTLRALLVASASFAFVPAAFAQIEEITVTATKMGETNLQETALAITAFTTEYLDQTGVRDVRDLAFNTPNLVVSQNGNSAQIYIRGIGSNNSFAGGETSSTVHLDGVFLARPSGIYFNFLDVERIEVLRGPQGTLYGRNSVGGTINIVSRKPTNELSAKAQFTVGNYDLWRAEGYVSGPIVEDKFAASLSASRSKRDGYFKNVVASGNDRGNDDSWSVRGQLRATPNERLDILVRGDYAKDKSIQNGNQVLLQRFFPVAGGPENPVTAAIFGDWFKVALNTPSVGNARTSEGLSGEITYEISDNLSLKSLTAYRKAGTGPGLSDTDATNLNRQTTGNTQYQNQFSQELNVSGAFGDSTYVAGLYLFDEDIDTGGDGVHTIATNIKQRPAPKVNTDAWAAFGQTDLALADQFTATLGLRYSHEKKHFLQRLGRVDGTTNVSLPGFPVTYVRDGKYEAWTPKFGLEFRPIEKVMFYASATRGFKSGGYNFSSANAVHGYGPERLWAYEAGFKSDLVENTVRFNGSAFYYDYTDLQVQAFITPGVTDITNASDAKIQGFELELQASPVAGLDLGASLNHLDAVYKNFPAAPITGGTFNASGKSLNSSPRWSYGLFANYSYDLANDAGSVFVRGEYAWKSRMYFTVVNDAIQTSPSYGLINANVGYTSPDERWTVVAYGRNLDKSQYLVSTGSFTAVPSGTPGEPRTYGLRLTFNY